MYKSVYFAILATAKNTVDLEPKNVDPGNQGVEVDNFSQCVDTNFAPDGTELSDRYGDPCSAYYR